MCDDVGWYLYRVPYGDPRWGKLQQCACGRDQAAIRRAHAAQALLGDELGGLSNRTFETFDQDRPLTDGDYPASAQRDALRVAYDRCAAYADAPRSWLYLHGPPGAGKSHLAAAIAHERAARGEQARYRSTPGLLAAIRDGFATGSSHTIYTDLAACDLLVLDDLGAEHLTDWSRELLFRLVNDRIGKPTVLTSNFHPDELAGASDVPAERIADRIAGNASMVWMPIGSYRRLRGAR